MLREKGWLKENVYGKFVRDWYWCTSRRTWRGTEKIQRKVERERLGGQESSSSINSN